MSEDGQVLSLKGDLRSDDDLLAFIAEAIPPGAPGIVAIDAPLAVPNDRGGRLCDREVSSVFRRYQAGAYPANRTNLGRYGGLRAVELRLRLEADGFRHAPYLSTRLATRRVIEVFPHPATVSLFELERIFRYKARRGRDCPSRRRELLRLRHALLGLEAGLPPLHAEADLAALQIEEQTGRALKQAEDSLDALVCAYSALYAWFHGPHGYAVYGGPLAVGDLADHAEAPGHILVPMTASMWRRIKGPHILFLDRDGTINHSPGERPPSRPDEVEILPGVGAILHRWASLGWRLVVVTNQGGVAFGYQTERQAWAIQQAVLEGLPVEIDASYLCPHHPEGTLRRYAMDCPNRKPAPGALLEALARYDAEPHLALFVGDQESDRQAAEAAGVPFAWAREFFFGTANRSADIDMFGDLVYNTI